MSEPILGPPDLLMIPHEEQSSQFDCVGRTGNGNQFIAYVTGAFPADWWSGNRSPEYLRNQWAEHKRWYAVLHQFDSKGNHLSTDVWCGGTTAEGQSESAERAWDKLDEMLATLGTYEKGNIRVKPFGVEEDGYFFGLVYKHIQDPDDPDDSYEYVMLEPSDVMFHPPWDSGEYST